MSSFIKIHDHCAAISKEQQRASARSWRASTDCSSDCDQTIRRPRRLARSRACYTSEHPKIREAATRRGLRGTFGAGHRRAARRGGRERERESRNDERGWQED
ncbi:unnamed protein product [Trichogramma brassicae]|uniref:Uncharacterized protein n=1 Tax=Trichogramma brassicae TaxID=86971 RepID=A0A6H5IM86_9HYME|nr:unnamed protein product [Trichogramma brassicae]